MTVARAQKHRQVYLNHSKLEVLLGWNHEGMGLLRMGLGKDMAAPSPLLACPKEPF